MRNVSPLAAMTALAVAALAVPAAAQDKELGLVVQNNVAGMLVDPNPDYANVKIEGGGGIVTGGAVSRYRAGRVKPLIPLSGKSEIGATQTQQGGAAATAPAAPAAGQR
ncbi:hypothetical protein [Sandarakinorhabdus rubra]|uniref:hypothetical protein n=1 Tax=Sandarakinorhabdus rubra TaxID=2672568 RepID=UPI0013D92D96|nr:hypothetical protein [Sandarakinorhabdus rubra]